MLAQQEIHDIHLCSHVFLTIVSVLSLLFSSSLCLSFSISMFSFKESSGFQIVAVLFLVLTIAIILISFFTILASCAESPKWMWFFQMVSIFLFCIFIIIFFLLVMRDLDFLKNGTIGRETCESKNYFQQKMQETSRRASQLLCSETCPCPNYTAVQQCPTWTSSPYDEMLQVAQNYFNCSGWCFVDSKRKFLFNKDKGFEVEKDCYTEWVHWTSQKWRKSLIYLAVSIIVIVVNIIATSYRCYELTKMTTVNLYDEDEQVN